MVEWALSSDNIGLEIVEHWISMEVLILWRYVVDIVNDSQNSLELLDANLTITIVLSIER